MVQLTLERVIYIDVYALDISIGFEIVSSLFYDCDKSTHIQTRFNLLVLCASNLATSLYSASNGK